MIYTLRHLRKLLRTTIGCCEMDQSIEKKITERARRDGIENYVVGALITRNCNILLVERPKDDFMGGVYEIPGGQVEEGETLAEALYREVMEETELKVREIRKYIGHFDYGSEDDVKTRQFNFLVEIHEPFQIRLHEHVNYAWVNSSGLSQYHVSDSMREVLNAYWQEKC